MAESWDERFYTPELKEHLHHQLVPRFHLGRGSRLLDVGGGTGGIIPYLLEAIGPEGLVWSIDFAEKMVEMGKKKFVDEPRVIFQVAAVESLPFEDRFFDHVVCYGAFPHFDDRKQALREMNRVLRSGGTLLIAHALSSEELKTRHQGVSPISRDFLPDEGEMRSLLGTYGFQVRQLIDEPKCYLCESLKTN